MIWKSRDLIPFKGILDVLLNPAAYGFSGSIEAGLRWLDRLALLGFLLAALLSVWLVRRSGFGPMEAAIVLWSLIGICMPRNFWEDCYSGPRVFTPLLLYVLLLGYPLARWRAMAPLLMVLPRVTLQVLAPLIAAAAVSAPLSY